MIGLNNCDKFVSRLKNHMCILPENISPNFYCGATYAWLLCRVHCTSMLHLKEQILRFFGFFDRIIVKPFILDFVCNGIPLVQV
ncbi:hypothetical protein Halhy_0682 [Haliscomenobacter hydrossis DSM 1100]|uniref:Uncharacterized protein n=1 Tax=Haliscomenobacter hydrossis (strain ATCC 27775 / DSM 1100 / LMG 10767 / O) TaxID=760192 RepID=F4L2M6_HALH1|nr:hypothetical protein Halhy_0682 [Haliscomenobacter hydrossis DSM 1100]